MHLIVDLIFCPITSDFRANLDFFAKKSDLIVDLIVHLIVDLILSHLAQTPTPVKCRFGAESNKRFEITSAANDSRCRVPSEIAERDKRDV